jgi:predicted metal-dependent hydrolase
MANNSKQTEKFPFSDWTVEVHRKSHRRSISIYLYANKPIKVMTGKSISQDVVYEFLLKKKDWIEKSFVKLNAHADAKPKRKIQSYQIFPFFGQELTLKMTITVLNKPFVAIQEKELRLHIPRNEWSANVLTDEHPALIEVIREFYKREAIKKITERTQHWAEQMKLFPKSLRFKEQKTRWGSCSSRGMINFNWRLIVFKPEIIDYVIIHELAHLAHMNHRPVFWGLVAKHCPEYEIYVKELRASQQLCEFLTPQ